MKNYYFFYIVIVLSLNACSQNKSIIETDSHVVINYGTGFDSRFDPFCGKGFEEKLYALFDTIKNGGYFAQIKIHSDARGEKEENKALTNEYSKILAEYIMKNLIDNDKFDIISCGDEFPVTIKLNFQNRNDTIYSVKQILTEEYINSFDDEILKEQLHAQNRRFEIKLIKIE